MSEQSAAEQTFRFNYVVFGVVATLDDARLIVRTGMKTVVAPIDRLQHLHVLRGPEREADEVLLTYTTSSGKLKRARVFSDRGEPAFEALVAALLARRPDIDIRGLPLAEVWQRVGTRPMEWAVLPVIMALGWVVVAVLFSPLLRHGFDQGHATVPVAALAQGAPGTRNLTVQGRVLLEGAVQRTETTRGGAHTQLWAPLVGPDWQPGDPVDVVIEARRLTGAQLDALLAAEAHTGILRDLFWEGLGGRQRADLLGKGVRLKRDVRLVEVGAEPATDRAIALGVLGFLGLMWAAVTWVMWRRRHPPTVQRPPLAGRPVG